MISLRRQVSKRWSEWASSIGKVDSRVVLESSSHPTRARIDVAVLPVDGQRNPDEWPNPDQLTDALVPPARVSPLACYSDACAGDVEPEPDHVLGNPELGSRADQGKIPPSPARLRARRAVAGGPHPHGNGRAPAPARVLALPEEPGLGSPGAQRHGLNVRVRMLRTASSGHLDPEHPGRRAGPAGRILELLGQLDRDPLARARPGDWLRQAQHRDRGTVRRPRPRERQAGPGPLQGHRVDEAAVLAPRVADVVSFAPQVAFAGAGGVDGLPV